MPLRSWVTFYQSVEGARLRHYARMVGVVHAKNPRNAQREYLKAAARVARGDRAVDLLRDPRALRRRIMGMPGVAVEDRAKEAPPEPEGA